MKTNHPLFSEQEHHLRGIALISVMAALFLTLLLEAMEQTVVSTALPRIVQELQGTDRYTWVVTAYLLASTAMIPVIVMVLGGLGIGILFPLLTLTAQNALPQTQLGVGTAAIRYLGQFGTTIGVALIGAIFAAPLTHASVHALPAALAQELAATALRHGFAAVAIFGLLAILAACFLKDVSLQPEEKEDEKKMVSRVSE